MEYLAIMIISIILVVILFLILNINFKKLKRIGEDDRLNEMTKDFPENREICEWMLKRLQNSKVKIKEDKESKTSLYVVIGDSITIANIRDSYTRIQTIAHECLHSVQNKNMLWFNFIFSNITILYFVIMLVLTVLKVIQNPMLFLCIFLLLEMVQYFVRSMLETEAMTKAKYLAKEYLEENQVCSKEEITELINQYDKLNAIGIPLVNFDLMARKMVKVIVYALVAWLI